MSPTRMLAESIVSSSPIVHWMTELEYEAAVKHVMDVLKSHSWTVEVVLN